MRIVIDKSSLFAMSGQVFERLCNEHDVCLPEVFFYELLTTTPLQRARLFRKVARTLMEREIAMQRPVDIVIDSALQAIDWIYDERLQDEALNPDEYLEPLGLWREDIAERLRRFRGRVERMVQHGFIGIADVVAGDRRRLNPLTLRLAEDDDSIRRLFTDIWRLSRQLEAPANFGPEYVGFSLLRSELLLTLELVATFGAAAAADNPSLENSYCDSEYAAIASHADAFLTRDRQLAGIFRLLAPRVLCQETTLGLVEID